MKRLGAFQNDEIGLRSEISYNEYTIFSKYSVRLYDLDAQLYVNDTPFTFDTAIATFNYAADLVK